MRNYVTFVAIVSAVVALLTLVISLTANVVMTSLVRASIALIFCLVVGFGARWLFDRFGSTEVEQEAEQPTDTVEAGQTINVQTPEDSVSLNDIYSQPDMDDTSNAFQPLDVSKVESHS